MRFALVKDERRAASPGLTGICPACGSDMISKCGDQRVHHWAHKGRRHCDAWWENETIWHRNWKNHFPENWQEIVMRDFSGEKHVADVRTGHELTIEFQHSHLKPRERAAREAFHGNLVWVVDGARLARDWSRFLEEVSSFAPLIKDLYLVDIPGKVFARNWCNCRSPVFFDFQDVTGLSAEHSVLARSLWCLLPGRVRGHAIVLRMPRETFVRIALERAEVIPVGKIHRLIEAAFCRVERAARGDPFAALPVTRRDPFVTAPRLRRRQLRRF